MSWKPIETAPMDGRKIQLIKQGDPDSHSIAYHRGKPGRRFSGWVCVAGGRDAQHGGSHAWTTYFYGATHWDHLQKQPSPEWDHTQCTCENNGDHCDYCYEILREEGNAAY